MMSGRGRRGRPRGGINKKGHKAGRPSKKPTPVNAGRIKDFFPTQGDWAASAPASREFESDSELETEESAHYMSGLDSDTDEVCGKSCVASGTLKDSAHSFSARLSE